MFATRGPSTNDQLPTPTNGTFPCKVVLVPQIIWLEPASAGVTFATRVIVTCATCVGQIPPLPTSHTKMYGPGNIIFTTDPKLPNVFTLATIGPDTNRHMPVYPCGAWLPINNAFDVSHNCWFDPANGGGLKLCPLFTTTTTSLVPQPLLTTQRNRYVPIPVKPVAKPFAPLVTTFTGLLGPCKNSQRPLPPCAGFATKLTSVRSHILYVLTGTDALPA